MEAEAVIVEYEQLLSAFKTRVSPKTLLISSYFVVNAAILHRSVFACPSNYNRCKIFECKLWQPRSSVIIIKFNSRIAIERKVKSHQTKC